jgi:arsenite methyltransferase
MREVYHPYRHHSILTDVDTGVILISKFIDMPHGGHPMSDSTHSAENATAHTAREVQQAVVDRYGARARRVLESVGVAPAADACCAPADTGAPQPVAVSFGAPTAAPATPAAEDACCGDDCCGGVAEAESTATSSKKSVSGDQEYGSALYPEADVSTLPASVVAASAGCGNPLAIAELGAGERVLDLGSGGGIDCFLAARQVGDAGEVWGLDMTPDMIALARHNAGEVGLENVHFRLGEIEDIPFGENSFDVIMSNCVINLSSDKERVFREAYRVLKPGGRLRVSDMVLVGELPEETRRSMEEWAGCIAGALPVEDYLDAIRAAGFASAEAHHEATDASVTSAYVTAIKP